MKQSRLKWHHIYYLLALFDLSAILASLYLTHSIMAVYSHSVAVNEKWAQRLTELTDLSQQAIRVNAPGNNVFDDYQVSVHRNERDQALAQFEQKAQDFRLNLLSISESGVRQRLVAGLAEVDLAMTAMTDEANAIFGMFEAGLADEAGSRMASMDRKAATLLDSINLLMGDIQAVQKENFDKQFSSAEALKHYELFIGIAILFMVGLVTVYGRRIALEFKQHYTQQERNHEELRKNAELIVNSEQRTRAIIEAVADGIIMLDDKGKIETVNAAAEGFFDFDRDYMIGKNIADLLPDNSSLIKTVLDMASDPSPEKKSGHVILPKIAASDIQVEVNFSPFHLGGKRKYTGVLRDITEQVESQEQIQILAFTDSLTKLSNRTSFLDQFEKILTEGQRAKTITALMLLDLDGFKLVNDTYGHPVGDELLKAVADRIKGVVRNSDLIFRLGGDEFAIVSKDVLNYDVAVGLADRVIREVSTPYKIGGTKINVGTSVGISFAPKDDTAPDELMRMADQALYQAKGRGKGCYAIFDVSFNDTLLGEQKIVNELRNAIERNQLVLWYQPQFDAESNEICGVEALLRWNHPDRGLIGPAEFMPVAEKSNLIVELDRWAIRRACRDWLALKAVGIELSKVAVNISGRHFEKKDFVSIVVDMVNEAGFPSEKLQFELTETVALKNIADCKIKMAQLKEQGITFALDDFGTGHTSLTYLSKLPLDAVKIDRSFVNSIVDDETTAIITQSLVKLGKKLGIEVIAEGMEDRLTSDSLLKMGCSKMQGYYHYRPVEFAALPDLINGRHPKENSSACPPKNLVSVRPDFSPQSAAPV